MNAINAISLLPDNDKELDMFVELVSDEISRGYFTKEKAGRIIEYVELMAERLKNDKQIQNYLK